MRTFVKEMLEKITPEESLNLLIKGNERFIQNIKFNRDLIKQAQETTGGQYPFATILSCIDSRTSSELVFDQGMGDIFSIRIAGNILNEDIIGSMEFACNVAGSKLLVVLGHSHCGAVKGACDSVKLGNLTTLLDKINPSIEEEKTETVRNSSNVNFVNKVTDLNVRRTVDLILEKSSVLREMVDAGKIGIIGGVHNIETGKVTFFEDTFRK